MRGGRRPILALFLIGLCACQPAIVRLRVPIRAPAGTSAPASALHVEIAAAPARGSPPAALEPIGSSRWTRHVDVTPEPGGYKLEATSMKSGLVTLVAWLDVDGDGKKGRGDVEGRIVDVAARHNGCTSSTIETEPLVLTPIP